MSKKELIELLTELLGTLPEMVLRQIDKYIAQGLTYKDIARAVYYIYSVQKQDRSKYIKFGIGLVPLVVDEANKYYDAIKRQQENQKKQVINAKEIPTREVLKQQRIKRKAGININEL